MDVNSEVKKLQQSRLLRNSREIEDFEQAIENIMLLNDVHLIQALCTGFDDQTEEHEVMWGLIHAIERFDGVEALFELAKSIPNMLPHAKEWATIFNYRILNHEPSRKLYITVLHKVDATIKDTITSLLIEIKTEDPDRFEKTVDEVLDNVSF